MSAVRKVERLHTSAYELIHSFREQTTDPNEILALTVKAINGVYRHLLPEVCENFVEAILGSRIKKPKIGGQPKSARMQTIARQLAYLKRRLEREAAAVAEVEKRYVARIARDTTMHELYIITHARLGKQNDHKGLARKCYSDEQLAKFKIILGE